MPITSSAYYVPIHIQTTNLALKTITTERTTDATPKATTLRTVTIPSIARHTTNTGITNRSRLPIISTLNATELIAQEREKRDALQAVDQLRIHQLREESKTHKDKLEKLLGQLEMLEVSNRISAALKEVENQPLRRRK